MQSIIDTISNAYDGVIFFFKDIFTSIKSFFVSLLETIGNYYDAVITYVNNVFISFKDFILDLPLLISEKFFSAVNSFVDYASNTILSYLTGSSSLSGIMQSVFNDIGSSSIGSTVLYCLNRSGIVSCFQILTVGLAIWVAVKVFLFIKSLIPLL